LPNWSSGRPVYRAASPNDVFFGPHSLDTERPGALPPGRCGAVPPSLSDASLPPPVRKDRNRARVSERPCPASMLRRRCGESERRKAAVGCVRPLWAADAPAMGLLCLRSKTRWTHPTTTYSPACRGLRRTPGKPWLYGRGHDFARRRSDDPAAADGGAVARQWPARRVVAPGVLEGVGGSACRSNARSA